MGQGIRAVDPAVAAGRQIPKAEPDSDGAVAGAIGAIPAAEGETGAVPVAVTFDGRLLVGRPEVGKPAE